MIPSSALFGPEALVKGAETIGQRLIDGAEKRGEGFFWKSVITEDQELNPDSFQENLYQGSAGIALFFLELFDKTGKRVYGDIGFAALETLFDFCAQHPSSDPSFFIGRGGVSIPFLRAYGLTGDCRFKDKAQQLVEPFLSSEFDCQVSDLLNGRAGSILALMHLLSSTGDQRFLPVIDRELGRLINAAQSGKEGVYWDRDPGHISGLCGFSHGAAGIGFVLMEAGSYFNNPVLFEMADRAFAYEMSFFSEEFGWPDLRKFYSSETEKQVFYRQYQKGNFSFFSNFGQMNVWCHGAPGLGLSRIRAFELTGKKAYLHQYRQAYDQFIKKFENLSYHTGINYTYCHGLCGDWDLLLEGFRVLDDPSLRQPVDQQAQAVLAQLETGQAFVSGFPIDDPFEDPSMFMGLAGIGHALLRAANPAKTPSILCPHLPAKCALKVDPNRFPSICVTTAGLRRMLLNKPFRRTLAQIQTNAPDLLDTSLASEASDAPLERLMDTAINRSAPKMNSHDRNRLRDIFTLESSILRFDRHTPSHALLHIRDEVHQEWVHHLGDSFELEPLALVVSEPHLFLQTTYNWPENEHQPVKGEPVQFLILALAEESIELVLDGFSWLVLSSFDEPNLVGKVVDNAVSAFDLSDKGEVANVRDLVLQQIMEAMRSGILVKPA